MKHDIEFTIKYIEKLISRKLNSEEIFIVGVAYQQGILRGIEENKTK